MTYDYDVLNRLAQVTVPGQAPTVYGYDEVGNLAGYTLPNGVATAYTYDNLNRLTAMSSSAAVPGGGALSSYTYTLGAAGNRTGVTELSGRTLAYSYDNLYRLTSETISSTVGGTLVCGTTHCGTVGYTYDPVGNRRQITSTLNAIPASGLLNYDANDRTSTDAYDDAGNTVSSGGIENVYDFENHLVRHGEVRITYDGDGNRVAENVGGTVTSYLVDTENPTGYAQVIDELQNGAVTRAYTYGLFRIDQTQQVEGVWTTSFHGYDGHGSVRQLLNTAGVVTDTYDYDAFGNLINSTGTTPNVYLYAGEAYDSTLGLYYNRARYLDVRAGRFWGMDTYEGDDKMPLSLHKYVYANATPVDVIDPTGEFGVIDLAASIAVIGTLSSMAIASPAQRGRKPSDVQFAVLTAALQDAKQLAQNALLDVLIFGSKTREYKTYFGNRPEWQVQIPLMNIEQSLSTYTVDWEVENGCEWGTGAHVIAGSGWGRTRATVTVCNPKFFRLEAWPSGQHRHFSRAGALFHEFTHLVAFTNDGSPAGPIGTGLKDDPLHNAYNLQYFAEEVALRREPR